MENKRKKGRYRLIALDMDGTALNDEKQMDALTQETIHQALAMGKEVIFCTGRSVAEMETFLAMFPDMHYLLCESGALIYDLQNKKSLHRDTFPADAVKALRETAAGRDIMPNVFSEGNNCLNRSQIDSLADYGMGPYTNTIPPIAICFEDVLSDEALLQAGAEKINFYHRTAQDRAVSRKMLKEKHARLVMADAETTSLECSPLDVDKGSGMRALSKITGISTEEMIMVGDANNDIGGLKQAGLAVAMGNANEQVKEICHTVVADNNHSGAAEAIRRFLLEDED